MTEQNEQKKRGWLPSGRLAQALAVAFALLGVGAAGWTLASQNKAAERRAARLADRPTANNPNPLSRGPGEGQRQEVRRAPGHGAPGAAASAPPVDYVFAPVNNEADVQRMIGELNDSLGSLARRSPEVNALGQKSASLAQAATSALGPYLLGSREQWESSMRSLGGSEEAFGGDDARARPLWTQLSAVLKNASVDASKAQIRPISGGPEDDRGGGVMKLRPAAMFPAVEGFEDKKLPAFEVRVPVLPAGSPEGAAPIEATVTMVWNEQTQSWQPGEFGFAAQDPAAMQTLMANMRKARE